MMRESIHQLIRRCAIGGAAVALVATASAPAFAQPTLTVRQTHTLIQQGQAIEALGRLQAVVKTNPNAADALATKAWLHATSIDPRVRNPRQAIIDAAHAIQVANYQQRRARAGLAGVTTWTKELRLANLYAAALAFASDGNYTQGVGHAIYAVEAARRLVETTPNARTRQMLAASERVLERIRSTDPGATQKAMAGMTEAACLVTGQDEVMGRPVEFAGVAPLPIM
jgi:hypothetical protein